jgi:UDP-N-acetylmuramyl tripeptide synthase
MKILAIFVGKLALLMTRLFKAGGGTTLPGLLAERIDKEIIRKLSGRLKHGVVIITGTNGKTTTAKMLGDILSEEGYRVLNNSSGSNLSRGIAAALVRSTNIFGTRLSSDIAVFEVDEATMPEVTTKLRPSVVLVTNLFRDQLDRYGERDKRAELIGGSLKGLHKMTTILNADDPLVAGLSKYLEVKAEYFGIDDESISTGSKAAMDSKDCITCGRELTYRNRYFGHLGVWRCDNCKDSRPTLEVSVTKVRISPFQTEFELQLPSESLEVRLSIPGLYNAYNALAAASAAVSLGVGAPAIAHGLRYCEAAFGRMEIISVKDQKVMVLLVKNPTGANQALAAIFSDSPQKKIAFVLNDNFADGTDISWIWDIDFEYFKAEKSLFVASGIRAEEIALRLKYAGLPTENILIEKDSVHAVEILAEKLEGDEIGYLLPTYTAMMEIRGHFTSSTDELCNLGKVTKHGI